MWMRKTPPGRAPTSQTGFEKPCGPHHCARCFGSVQAFQTSSRGASNTRTRSSCFASTLSLLALVTGMRFLLFLQFAQIFVETIEALLPESSIFVDPFGDVFERAGLEVAGTPLGLAATGDQARALQDLEMLGNRRHADVERLRQFGHRGVAGGEPCEDGAAGGIGEGGEGIAQRVGGHLY